MGVFDFMMNDGNSEPIKGSEASGFLGNIAPLNRRALFGCVLYAGISSIEVLALRWNDIDLHSSTMHIYDSNLKRVRIVFMPPELVRMLTEYHQSVSDRHGPIFPFSRYVIEKDLQTLTVRYFGVKKNWHVLRQSFLLAARKTLPMDIVAENMGISPTQLMKYWQREPEETRKLIARFSYS